MARDINIIESETTLEEKRVQFLGNSTFDNIIRTCVFILLFLLPLWFLPITDNALGLSKQLLLGILTGIVLIAWLGKLISQEGIKWYKGLVFYFFLAFVLIYGIATIFSVRPYTSLVGLDVHLSRSFINIIYFFIFFVVLVNYLAEKSSHLKTEIIRFLTIFLASSFLVSIISLFQIFGLYIFPWGFTKINSFNPIGTITALGLYLVLIMTLALGLLFSLRSKVETKKEKVLVITLKTFLLVLGAVSLLIIFLLNIKIVWVVTTITMLILSGFILARRFIPQSNQNLNWLAVPIVILGLSIVFLMFKPVLFSFNFPAELSLTNRGSLAIVKKAITETPILGNGPESFSYSYSLYKPENINQTAFWNLRLTNASSEIFSLIPEIGILGIFSFLVLVGVFLFLVIKGFVNKGLKEISELEVGLFAGWLGLFVAWFLYPQNITLMFVFWLLFVLLLALTFGKNDLTEINLRKSEKAAIGVSFAFILLVIVIIGLLYIQGSRYVAEAEYRSGLNLVNQGKINEGITKISRAIQINPYEDKFSRNLSQIFLIQQNQIQNNQNLDQNQKTEQIQLAISNAINSAVRATNLNRKNVSNWIVRASVYRSLANSVEGATDWAINSYKEAVKLEPSNPFIYTELARSYIDKANLIINKARAQNQNPPQEEVNRLLEEAVNSYNKAIEVKPNYAPAHFELAILYDRLGKTKEAIAKMENSFQLAPRDTGVLFQLGVLYYKDSQFEKAKQAFASAVSIDPNFSNARYFLGLLYDREGNKEAAIAQFEKIAELNPDNELVKNILENLRAGKPALGSPELGPPEQPQEVPIEEQP